MKILKIPREIILDQFLLEKRVLIFCYLCMRRAYDGTVALSTQELCRWSYMKPNYNPGKINEKYYDTLRRLALSGYFAAYPDFAQLMVKRSNSNDFIILTLNTEKFDVKDNFCLIYEEELNEILKPSSSNARPPSAHLLLFLAYIRLNINKSPEQPRCCFRHFKTISHDTGLSERMVSKCAQSLQEMEILMYDSAIQTSTHTTAPKIFADCKLYRKIAGIYSSDSNYNAKNEIEKQKLLLEKY